MLTLRFIFDHLLLSNFALSGTMWRSGSGSAICNNVIGHEKGAAWLVGMSFFAFASLFTFCPFSPAKGIRRGTIAILILLIVDSMIGVAYAHLEDEKRVFKLHARKIENNLGLPFGSYRRSPSSFFALASTYLDRLNSTLSSQVVGGMDMSEYLADIDLDMYKNGEGREANDVQTRLSIAQSELYYFHHLTPSPISVARKVVICLPHYLLFALSPGLSLIASLIVVVSSSEEGQHAHTRRRAMLLYFLLVFYPLSITDGDLLFGHVITALMRRVGVGSEEYSADTVVPNMIASLISISIMLVTSLFILHKYRMESAIMYGRKNAQSREGREEEKKRDGCGQGKRGEKEEEGRQEVGREGEECDESEVRSENGRTTAGSDVIPLPYIAVIMWMKERTEKIRYNSGVGRMHMRVEDGGEAQWWSPCLPSYFHHPNVISAPPLHMFDLFIAMVGSCMYAAGALHIIRSISNDWVDDSILGVIATCFRLFALGVGGYAATARHKILLQPRFSAFISSSIVVLLFVFVLGVSRAHTDERRDVVERKCVWCVVNVRLIYIYMCVCVYVCMYVCMCVCMCVVLSNLGEGFFIFLSFRPLVSPTSTFPIFNAL